MAPQVGVVADTRLLRRGACLLGWEVEGNKIHYWLCWKDGETSQGNKDIKKAMNEEGIRWKLEMMLLCLYWIMGREKEC